MLFSLLGVNLWALGLPWGGLAIYGGCTLSLCVVLGFFVWVYRSGVCSLVVFGFSFVWEQQFWVNHTDYCADGYWFCSLIAWILGFTLWILTRFWVKYFTF